MPTRLRPLRTLILCAALATPAAAPAQSPTSADARLRALYDGEWRWRGQELNPDGGTRFPRVDPASQQARLAYWTRALATLDSIPFAELSPEEQVNAQVFRAMVEGLASDVRWRTYEAPFNSDTFFWTEGAPRGGLRTAADYRRWFARLRDLPRYFDEQIANMRAGLARGYSVPRVAVQGRDATIVPYTRADTTNPLRAPLLQIPATIPADERAALRQEGETVVRDVAVPAYAKLLTMMRAEYLPRARTTLAARALPDGETFYKAQI